VKLRGALRDELLTLRSARPDGPQDAYLFPTTRGKAMNESNFRQRVLGKPAKIVDGERVAGPGAIPRATERLEAEGLPPLPTGITPHSLRHTFCSILYALGEDPGHRHG
jgi:integrase